MRLAAALLVLLAAQLVAAQLVAAQGSVSASRTRSVDPIPTYDLEGASRADARVHFVTDGDARLAVSYGRRLPDETRRRVCLAPCDAVLSPGSYRFWLAPDGHGDPIETEPVALNEGQHVALRLRYSDHSVLRGVGIAFFALTAVIAIVVAGWASVTDFTLVTLTPLLGAVSTFITGLALASVGDSARVEPLRR